MKIRIKGDSIRLRLAQTEVDAIGELNSVSESTHFANSTFNYTLKVHDDAQELIADYSNDELSISVNKSIARAWATSEKVGISSSPGMTPKILIEKDFQCLTVREGEDESDLFHNPNTVC